MSVMIFKRAVSVCETIQESGFWNTLIRVNKKRKFIPVHTLKKIIIIIKKIAHPVEYLQRKYLAYTICSYSQYKRYIPRDIAYKKLNAEDIPESQAIVSACQNYIKRIQEKIENIPQKRTLIFPLVDRDLIQDGNTPENACRVCDIPGLEEFMVNPRMLEMVTCYLGEAPIIASANLYMSLPNDTLIGSQRFHFDGESFRQIQFIFAITDVDEETGPFTLIPGDKADLINRIIDPAQSRISDEEVYQIVDKADAIKLIGPAGSVWAVDSSRCLHYGSRGNKKVRCHLQMQYMSRFAPVQSSCELLGVVMNKKLTLSTLQKMALSITKIYEN